MIKVIAIDEMVLNTIIDVVNDYRDDVESGSVIVEDAATELHELDEALAAFRNAESE